LEREALSVIVKFFAITSKVSPNQLSEDWLAEGVSSVSLA